MTTYIGLGPIVGVLTRQRSPHMRRGSPSTLVGCEEIAISRNLDVIILFPVRLFFYRAMHDEK